MRQKMAIFKEGNSVCRVHFFQELSFYIQKELTNDFFQINFENALRPVENQGDDATENDNFQRRKQRLRGSKNFSRSFQRGSQHLQGRKNFKLNFDEFFMKDRGTMRQKMSIFKVGNSACRGAKSQVELKHLTIEILISFSKF